MKSDSKTTSLRRKYLHLQLEKRKQGQRSPSFHVDRPRGFTQRAGVTSLWKIRAKKLGVIAAAIIAILGFMYVLFFSPLFIVTRVQIEKSGASVTADRLQPFIDEIKNRNILFVNGDRISDDLISSFPKEILYVTVKKSFPQRVTLKIDEYPLAVNFHINTPKGVQKLVINQIGFVVAQNVDFKDIPTLEMSAEKELPIAEGTILSDDKLKPILTSFTKFQELFGIKVIAGEWRKIERELHLKTEKKFEVWLDLTQDVTGQLSKLKRSLPKLDIYNEKLSYIDLRIAGTNNERVYFMRRK